MKVILMSLILSCSAIALAGTGWLESAKNLNSEKLELQQKAMLELSENKKIDAQLELGLQSESWKEALFVIHKLKKKGFLKRLFKIADDDDKDLSLATINSMIDEESAKTIREFYKNKEYKVHKPGHEYFKISFLQAAIKTKLKVEKKIMKKLLKDDSHEVRMAVEDYFFNSISFYSREEQLKFFKLLLKTSPYQVRMHTLLDYSSLESSLKKELESALDNCLDDKESEVKEKCNALKASP